MIRPSVFGIWCDYCKDQWGKVGGHWHPKAMTQAHVTITSELAESKSMSRSYCKRHMDEVCTWSDGLIYTFADQIADAIARKEVIYV